MTIEQYEKATKILEEKKGLEEQLYPARMSINFTMSDKCTEICDRLFTIGQEFAAL